MFQIRFVGVFVAALGTVALGGPRGSAQEIGPEVPEELEFRWVPVAEGMELREQRRTEFTFAGTIHVDGKLQRNLNQSRRLSVRKHVRLKRWGEAGRELEAQYLGWELETRGQVGERVETTLKGERLRVTSEVVRRLDGDEVGEAVEAAARGEESLLLTGRRFHCAKVATKRAWRVGEGRAIDPELAATLLDANAEGFPIERMRWVLEGRERISGVDCGRFDVVVEGRSEDGGAVTELELKGQVWVELDTGRVRRLKLAGPIAISSDTKERGETVSFRGKGELRIEQTITVKETRD